MIKLVYAKAGDDSFKINMAKWVASRTFMVRDLKRTGDYEVIGVAEFKPECKMLACLLFHNYCAMGDGGHIEISMAADTPRWARKGVIGDLLYYPFHQLRCHVVICTTNRTNKRTRRFLTGIGFKEKGTIDNRPYADDTVIYQLRIETAIERGWIKPRVEEKAA